MNSLHISKNIQIIHYTDTNIMYCNWVGPQSQETITQSGITMLKLLKENQFTKVLNDNTSVTGPWNTAVTWTVEEWFPAMITAGMQHFAWVFSPDIFAELSAKRAITSHNVVKTFNEYPQALRWLTTIS